MERERDVRNRLYRSLQKPLENRKRMQIAIGPAFAICRAPASTHTRSRPYRWGILRAIDHNPCAPDISPRDRYHHARPSTTPTSHLTSKRDGRGDLSSQMGEPAVSESAQICRSRTRVYASAPTYLPTELIRPRASSHRYHLLHGVQRYDRSGLSHLSGCELACASEHRSVARTRGSSRRLRPRTNPRAPAHTHAHA